MARKIIRHARNRLKSRYKITLKDNQIGEIASTIRDNIQYSYRKLISKEQTRLDPHRYICQVEYKGQMYRVVYDEIGHKIVTFLPL